MEEELYKNESKIREIGGKLSYEYDTLKRNVEYINETLFNYFSYLRLTITIDLILEAINHPYNLKEIFVESKVADIESGKVSKWNYIPQITKEKLKNLPPEEREKKEKAAIHRKLHFTYNEVVKNYKGIIFNPLYRKDALELCSSALTVTPYGIGIDADEFIRIYEDYTKASQSITGKLHKETANAINTFFNGIEITPKEILDYFTIKCGKVVPNPEKINSVSYSRLGTRAKRKN